MRIALCLVSGAIVAICASALGSTDPEEMQCRQVIVVKYHPGPAWDDFSRHQDAHLRFLRAHMKSGKLLYAGPFSKGTGGLSVYDLTDARAVDAIVQADPLIAHKVVTYSLHHWRMCSLRTAEGAGKEK